MKKVKEAKKRFLAKAEDMLDISDGILNDLPNIILYGTSRADIDNFKGLLDFSQSSVRINTSDGILRLDGTNLIIAIMTDESVCIKGNIKNISFE